MDFLKASLAGADEMEGVGGAQENGEGRVANVWRTCAIRDGVNGSQSRVPRSMSRSNCATNVVYWSERIVPSRNFR